MGAISVAWAQTCLATEMVAKPDKTDAQYNKPAKNTKPE
jgi:hypothetical protein